jgi:hypothetical protein
VAFFVGLTSIRLFRKKLRSSLVSDNVSDSDKSLAVSDKVVEWGQSKSPSGPESTVMASRTRDLRPRSPGPLSPVPRLESRGGWEQEAAAVQPRDRQEGGGAPPIFGVRARNAIAGDGESSAGVARSWNYPTAMPPQYPLAAPKRAGAVLLPSFTQHHAAVEERTEIVAIP